MGTLYAKKRHLTHQLQKHRSLPRSIAKLTKTLYRLLIDKRIKWFKACTVDMNWNLIYTLKLKMKIKLRKR